MRRARSALVLIVLISAGCASGPRAQVGHRVSVPASREISPPESPDRGRTVVGELARQVGDTVWIRVQDSVPLRRFELRGSADLRSIQARSADDAWMGGDSLRVRRPRFGSAEPPVWRVEGRVGDTLHVAGPDRHPRTVLSELREPPVSRRADRVRVERRTVRARPGTAVVMGVLTTAIGVGLAAASRSQEPVQLGEEKPQDFILPMLASVTLLGGGVMILTAFMPRPGWDEVDPAELPPMRLQPSPDGGLRIGLELPVGFGSGWRTATPTRRR